MKQKIFFAISIGIFLGWIVARIALRLTSDCPVGYEKISDEFNAYADSRGRGFFCAKSIMIQGNQEYIFK